MGKNKIILFKIFQRAKLFVLGKIGWLRLIYFSFTISNFLVDGLIFF